MDKEQLLDSNEDLDDLIASGDLDISDLAFDHYNVTEHGSRNRGTPPGGLYEYLERRVDAVLEEEEEEELRLAAVMDGFGNDDNG